MKFSQKLDQAINKNKSLLCVGLDPSIVKGQTLTEKGLTLYQFNKWIITQTADFVCAYKPNIAFYEALGIEGLKSLKLTIEFLHEKYSHIPIILDAKRSDIESTSEMYAKAIFDYFKADATTVNPYFGFDSLRPFFKRFDRGIIVLCKTSNPGAGDFQDLEINGQPLFLKIAKKIHIWDKKYRNLLMVVSATYPRDLLEIRKIAPQMTFLVPGIGTQGGNLQKTLKYGLRPDGQGLIISSSRSIIYAQDPRSAAQKLRNEINKYR